jgi:hypothetical protein
MANENPEKKTAKEYFALFEQSCPLYAAAGGVEGKDIDRLCIEACHCLIMAMNADKTHEDNIAGIITQCGGHRGKECGRAVNLYELEKGIVDSK